MKWTHKKIFLVFTFYKKSVKVLIGISFLGTHGRCSYLPLQLNSLGNAPHHPLLTTKGLSSLGVPGNGSAQMSLNPEFKKSQNLHPPLNEVYFSGKNDGIQTQSTDCLSLKFSPPLKFSSSLKITAKEEKPQGFLKKKSTALFHAVLKTFGLVPKEPEPHVILLPQELQAPHVRGPEALTVNHVLDKFKGQVQPLTPDDVRQVALKVAPEAELPKTLETFYWMTQFGRMNSLNTLVREMHLLQSPQTPLLLDHLPGSISSMIHYLREKGNFAYLEENGLDNMMYIASNPEMLNYYLNNRSGRYYYHHEDPADPKNQGSQALGSLLLDAPLIREMASNPELRRFVKKNNIHLLVPEGWMEGVNPFTQSSLEDMAGRLSVIYRRAKAIEERYQKMSEVDSAVLPLTWRGAVSVALQAPFHQWIRSLAPELQNNMKFLTNTQLPSPAVSQFTQTPAITYQSGDVTLEMSLDEAICENLKPQLILPQDIEVALQTVSRDPLVKQAALEVLSQAGEIYSPRRTALALKAMHQKIMAFAKEKNISEENIYYVLPRNRGSFCVVNQMYRMINDIASERFLVCPDLQSEDRTDIEHHEEKWIQFCEMLSAPSHQHRESSGSVGRWLLQHAKKGILNAFSSTHHAGDSKTQFSRKNMVVVLDDLAGSGHTLGNVFWYQLRRSVSENAWIYLAPIVSTRTALDTGHIKKYQASYPGLVYEPHHWIDTFPSTDFYKGLTPAEKTLFEAIFQDKGYAGVNTNIVFPWMGTDTNNRFWGRFFVSPHTLNGFGNKHVGKAWKEIQQLKSCAEETPVAERPPKAC